MPLSDMGFLWWMPQKDQGMAHIVQEQRCSATPENGLDRLTVSLDDDLEEGDNGSSKQDEEEVQTMIGNFLASTSDSNNAMTEESTDVVWSQKKGLSKSSIGGKALSNSSTFSNVFLEVVPVPDEEEEVRPKPISNENIERFRSTVSCLNSLLLRTVVTNEGGERSNGYIINANGS